MKYLEWFKDLDYRFHYLIGIAVWTILWFWIGNIIGHINWCPEVEYSFDCDLRWLNFASTITSVIIWGSGLIALVFYHDHVKARR